jgi:hypothetical protein
MQFFFEKKKKKERKKKKKKKGKEENYDEFEIFFQHATDGLAERAARGAVRIPTMAYE